MVQLHIALAQNNLLRNSPVNKVSIPELMSHTDPPSSKPYTYNSTSNRRDLALLLNLLIGG